MNFVDLPQYNFIEPKKLRNDIIHRIRESGRRKIVFVEDLTDEVIYEILFEEYIAVVSFIGVIKRDDDDTGGCELVKKLLKDCVSKLPNDKRFYGVVAM